MERIQTGDMETEKKYLKHIMMDIVSEIESSAILESLYSHDTQFYYLHIHPVHWSPMLKVFIYAITMVSDFHDTKLGFPILSFQEPSLIIW